MRRNKSNPQRTATAMSTTIASKYCNASIIILPILFGAMYTASYDLNTSKHNIPASDRAVYLQTMLFVYSQFLMGYASGMVMLAIKFKILEMENLPYEEMKDPPLLVSA